MRNALARQGDAYLFVCRAADETIEYRFRPAAGLLAGLVVPVIGKTLAGLSVRVEAGKSWIEIPAGAARVVAR